MKDFPGKVAVITGAGSGFGREFARIGAARGMKLVLADIEADALEATRAELEAGGAEVAGLRVDVSKGDEVEALADLAYERFGAVHLLFNNAGVGSGGFVWENSVTDWDWVLGVNLWGVIHGVRSFVPRMIDGGADGHVVNTASVAGLLSPQLMGVYNVSKHAVVTLTETLYQDLRIAGARIGVTLLCPAFVPTGIAQSQRNRPETLKEADLTESQKAAAAQTRKAVSSGKITAADVGRITFEAIEENRFYCLTHPKILGSVELRMRDIIEQRNPSDPLSLKPQRDSNAP
jgi:NAD(P)-dependent dehydrogenase (short-subunit alcohol dehydrogenase family)